jgi:GNAT superfamily N-acetyltransferase
MTTTTAALDVRRATAADRPAVLALLGAALGWGDDERFAAFFAWKHQDNPSGASPGWVALAGERVVGFRTFLCWELEGPEGPVRAVRAVDTATHPDHQRRGIFSRLTATAAEELAAEGVDLVFNTPNDRSGPGYTKLGWHRVGPLPVSWRPTSAMSILRMAGARCPAERWSLPVEAGQPAGEVLADPFVAELVASQPPPTGLRTRRSPAFLAWRYGHAPLRYRAVPVGSDLADGFALFRARRRGRAVEGTLCDILVPGADPRLAHRARARVAAVTGLDYVLDRSPTSLRSGFLPLPGQAPTLYARGLASPRLPAPAGWDLSLGDVELF